MNSIVLVEAIRFFGLLAYVAMKRWILEGTPPWRPGSESRR